jgi:Tol biopolymer transport system component
VWISSPPTAAPKRYLPNPFASKDIHNVPKLKFSPDGKKLLLNVNGGRQREESWILPYPPNPSNPPHQVLQDLQSVDGTPVFSWMPDSRHVVLGLARRGDNSQQLWMADTESNEFHAVTSGTAYRSGPSVAPDGQKLIFGEDTGSYDVISVDLATAAARPLLATERDESMPSWSANKPLLAYVTDRNGPQEIWLHSDENSDRPLVTARDFPGVTVQWFMCPALSPQGDRVVYAKVDQGGAIRLWISALSGGQPVQLTNEQAPAEYPGSWSLDGNWFAYVIIRDGKSDLAKVKTSGQATPVTVRPDVDYDNDSVPAWSPDGNWIVLGETLYSSDGKTVHPLGEHHSDGYVFSQDGKRVYGMRPSSSGEELFSVDIASGTEKVIGSVSKDLRPRSSLNPGTRLSLAPDGKSIAYAAARFQDNLWLLEGFAPKAGWLQRLGF